MTSLTFLGTGNFSAEGRYWNSFVIDNTVLVEPCPTALPHLRMAGVDLAGLEVIAISHFHPDHTFGWPFLLLDLLRQRAGRPLYVVGPPEVEKYLADMNHLAGIPEVQAAAHQVLDLRYVEVDGSWQDVGQVRLRAVEVEHVPHLRCYGYLFERDGRTIGYSGDTAPCAGLDELAGASEVLVVECNGRHPFPSHMDTGAVVDLHQRFPDVHLIATHMGGEVTAADLPGITVPNDFEVFEV